ncbi:hypothetical protein [Clostridium sp. FP1]|uniref:hypothetical protein n=1 Tax=Clostridium sp. FP1 TaxID=2724076 RepID=UPI0013E90503|nr:hypothetical protein [Clostridium sp. FP1]MBZ9634835.1 hypothetical protein [Clostridium sp. FP1]
MSEEHGYGGDTFIAKEFNVSRDTLTKSKIELQTGIRCEDAFNMRGRTKIEDYLPSLMEDIKAILDSKRLYTCHVL